MQSDLSSQAIRGMLWSAMERFSVQGVQFVVSVIMARLLLPSDYGIVAMLFIVLQISQTLIDSGFANALIQRKDRSESDLSTVFYSNITISVILFLLIYLLAPCIAGFYRLPALTPVCRVISLSLVLNAMSAVHRTLLVIKVDFKTQSKISVVSAVSSGIFGIALAYWGAGAWALVGQSVSNALLQTLLFYAIVRWFPHAAFSIRSFYSLFAFGSRILVASLIHTVYYNLYALIIGRKFSTADLGYYTRAEQLAMFPSYNLSSIISRVTFPVMSSVQDDDALLARLYRQYRYLVSYVIFPLMFGLIALARPTILFLLTEKWQATIPILQILCFSWMFDHLYGLHLNLLYTKGRSDLSLKLEIIKKILAILILFASIPFGLMAICWSRVLYSLIAVGMSTMYTYNLVGITAWSQIRDILPCFFLAAGMGLVVYCSVQYISGSLFQLVAGILIGIVSYTIGSIVFNVKAFTVVVSFFKH